MAAELKTSISTGSGNARLDRALKRLIRKKADPIYAASITRNSKDLRRTTFRRSLSGQRLRVVSGRTRRDLRVDLSQLPLTGFVGFTVIHAPPLEFGWPKKNIRARRMLLHGVDKAAPKFPDAWIDEIDRAMVEEGGR